jgi:outer membrane protein OmpA-like peptidoglycan-associated protein
MQRVMLVVGIAAVLGCSGVSKEQYKAKEAEAAKYKQSTEEQGVRATTLENKVTALEQQNSTLQTQNQDLEAKLSESTAAKAAMAEKAPVQLSEQLLFKENSSKLTPESKRALDAVAQAISKSKDQTVLVSGYTDDAESGGKNALSKRWQLSSARALEVAKYLAGRGVNPMTIGVLGFGPARPVAPNDSLANRALNRRAEIALAPAKLDMKTIEVRPAELTPQKK